MSKRMRLFIVLTLALGVVLTMIYPGAAQQSTTLSGLILNGDFEGAFYAYGSGYVAQYWLPYDLSATPGAPQFLRSTLYKHDGQASQQIWADTVPYYAGIMQTTVLTSGSNVAHIQAGKRYTVRIWMYSIYGGAGSPVQYNKLNKRVGVHPSGGTDPNSSSIVWTPWYGQDKTWIQIINPLVEAKGDRLTIFIEANDPKSGGQDQVYIDSVTLEEYGAPTPTRTSPPPTITPTPTATPAIAVLRSVPVGQQPKGIAVMPDINRFLVANNGDDTVSSLDGFLDWRHRQFPSGGDHPSNVAVDPERCLMYVVNTASSTVAVLSACGNVGRSVGSVSLGEGKLPEGIAVLTTTNTIYVANAATNSVAVINGNTLVVTKNIPVGALPAQIAVNPHTNRVYVTCRGYPLDNSGAVAVIDANTQSVIQTIDLSYGEPISAPEPYGVAVNPLTNLVYVASGSGKLVVIDGATNQAMYAVSPPVPSALAAVAVNSASNNVFVCSTGNTVFVYDADMGEWIRTFSAGTGVLGGLAVNPLTFQVLVSDTGQGAVSVIRDFGLFQPFRFWLPVILK